MLKNCCKKRKKEHYVYCDVCDKKLIPEHNLIVKFKGSGFTNAGNNSNKK